MNERYLKNIVKDYRLSANAKKIITYILLENSKMEVIRDITLQSNLGFNSFQKALDELLDLGILEWVNEKQIYDKNNNNCKNRRKGLYYGTALLEMGIDQVVKSYQSVIEKKPVKQKKYVDTSECAWYQPGLGYEDPHRTQGRPNNIIYTDYYVTDIENKKKNFILKMQNKKRIPTEHLYRKAMARFKKPEK